MSDRHRRSYDFTVTRQDDTDDGLTLEGYAAVFGQQTTIRDWLGEYEETVAKGAFAKTLQERTPILQFDHGSHNMIGSIPIGSIRKLTEDDHGLFVRARLSDNWLVQPVRDAIRDGAITGMSFQFAVTRDEWDKEQTFRTIREVKLFELGPVVWPAYEQTTVGVRSEITDLLACENVRMDLARALAFPDAVREDTSEKVADTPPPAPVAPDKKAAAAAARLAKLAAAPSDYLIKEKI